MKEDGRWERSGKKADVTRKAKGRGLRHNVHGSICKNK